MQDKIDSAIKKITKEIEEHKTDDPNFEMKLTQAIVNLVNAKYSLKEYDKV